MKIFKMNGYDWVAAKNLESAKQALADTMNGGIRGPEFEAEFIDNPHTLPKEDLDRLLFVDEDIPDMRITFRQELHRRLVSGERFPQFFASSEF